MNTKKIAVASTLGALAVIAVLFALPAMAAAASSPQTTNPQRLMQHSAYIHSQKIQLSVGQNITLTSVAGGYWLVGDRASNGTASGTISFRVTGAFAGGYTISVTGGSLNINETTYNISSGSAELGSFGRVMVGQAQAGSAQFMFLDRNLGKFGSTSYGVVRVDLTSGTSEFAARLLVTISA